MTAADRQARYRARNGATIGAPPGPRPATDHGTTAGHRRHLTEGEKPCDPCRLAYNTAHRAYYARRKQSA